MRELAYAGVGLCGNPLSNDEKNDFNEVPKVILDRIY